MDEHEAEDMRMSLHRRALQALQKTQRRLQASLSTDRQETLGYTFEAGNGRELSYQTKLEGNEDGYFASAEDCKAVCKGMGSQCGGFTVEDNPAVNQGENSPKEKICQFWIIPANWQYDACDTVNTNEIEWYTRDLPAGTPGTPNDD